MKYPIGLALLLMLGIGCSKNENSEIGQQECADLTSGGQQVCEKTNAIQGKKCVWLSNKCVEDSQALTAFMAQDRNFANAMIKNTDAFGTEHGECPHFGPICATTANNDIEGSLSGMILKFKKDALEVDLVLDCSKAGGANNKTYKLAYTTKPVDKDNLLITLDLKGQKIIGGWDTSIHPKTGNVLEFFSKADLLYSKRDNAIKFVIELGNLGYRVGEPLMPLNNEQDFDKALSNIKVNHFGIASTTSEDVIAICLIFKNLP